MINNRFAPRRHAPTAQDDAYEVTAIHQTCTLENLIFLLLALQHILWWRKFIAFILVDVQNTLSNILEAR